MSGTPTNHYGFLKPDVGGDDSVWGDMLNASFDAIDSILFSKVSKSGDNMFGPLNVPNISVGDVSSKAANTKFVADSLELKLDKTGGNVNVLTVITSCSVPDRNPGDYTEFAANTRFVKDAIDSAMASSELPTGAVISTVGREKPSGRFLEPNGALISRTTYSDLFSAITKSDVVTFGSHTSGSLVSLYVNSASHGNRPGDKLRFTTTGTLPNGLTPVTTDYYVMPVGFSANGYCVGTATPSTKMVKIVVGSPTVIRVCSTHQPELYEAHGLTAGTQVVFYGYGLPTGITSGQVYFVISTGLTSTEFRISATYGGSAVNTTGTSNNFTMTSHGQTVVSSITGSGTHTATYYPYGAGDGSTTFALPDFRSGVLRNWNYNHDYGRVFGSWQDDSVGFHDHRLGWGAGGSSASPWEAVNTADGNDLLTAAQTLLAGTFETRMKNIAVRYWIKY